MSENPFMNLGPDEDEEQPQQDQPSQMAPTQPNKEEQQNPFMNLGPDEEEGGPHTAPQAQQPSLGARALQVAEDTAAGINLAVGSMARGVLQVALPKSAENALQLDQQQERDEKDYSRATKRSPYASRIGYGAGAIGTAVAVPGGAVKGATTLAKVGSGALRGATSGAAFAGLQHHKEGQSRTLSATIGGILGGTVGAAAPAVGGLLKKAAKPFSKTAAKKTIDDAVSLSDKGRTKATVKAADKLGVKVSPAEATGSPVLRAREGRLPINKETQELAAKTLIPRERKLKAQTTKLIRGIVPEGERTAVKTAEKLYSKAYTKSVPKETIRKLHEDVDFIKISKRLAGRGNKAPKTGTIAHLDAVKRDLDGMIEKEFAPGGNKTIGRELKQLRTEVVSAADKASPTYAQARKISQRVIIKQNMQKRIDKLVPTAGNNKASMSQIYKELFSSTDKKREFLEDLSRAGADSATINQAKSLITVLNSIDKSTLGRLLGKQVESLPKIEKLQGVYGAALNKASEFLSGRYNEELIDLTLNGRWSKEATKLRHVKDPKKLVERLSQVLSRIRKVNKSTLTARVVGSGIGNSD